jgi:hypothetical protein
MNAEEMKAWAKNNNRFLRLADGESITAVLKGAKSILKDFKGQEKEVIRYSLITDEGKEKIFENGSIKLVNIMSDMMGKKITIIRHGEGTDTRYEIKEVSTNSDKVSSPDEIPWEE